MASRWSLLGLSISLGAALGCGGGDKPPAACEPDPSDDGRAALLAHLANDVLRPIHTSFAAHAAALTPAITAYCAALDAGDAGATLDAARGAWRDAFDAWQPADALLVGPAAMDNKTLRDNIYAWPLISACDLDRDTASRFANPAGYDVTTKLARVRSLASIEYLLFTTSTDHNCLNAPPGWDALMPDLPRARCRLAEALAVDVAVQGAALAAAWQPEGGNFAAAIAGAGQCESSIATRRDALNLISDAMFYVESMVKDMKVAEAAGIAMNACGTVGEPCLREVESPLADRESFAIRADLAALEQAFTGTTPAGDGPGFDDLLRGLGQGELGDRMAAKIDAAIVAADALPDSFIGALTTDYQKVVDMHAALSLFTDDLKTQFVTVLALDRPDEVAADND